MHLISNRKHITKDIPDELTDFITKRFEQLSEETDVPPIIILVKAQDDITGPDYAFIGSKGLLSDMFEEHQPGENGFIRPYEFCSIWPDLGIYELLLLQDPDNGYWIIVPESIVEANPELKWVMTDESLGGINPVQPLYGSNHLIVQRNIMRDVITFIVHIDQI